LRTKLLENYRTFKNHTVDRFVTLVEVLMKNEPLVKDASDVNFRQCMVDRFNRENSFQRFYYIKNYIKFESRDMGSYFMKSKIFLSTY
jgi:hypothetical protein